MSKLQIIVEACSHLLSSCTTRRLSESWEKSTNMGQKKRQVGISSWKETLLNLDSTLNLTFYILLNDGFCKPKISEETGKRNINISPSSRAYIALFPCFMSSL